MTTIKLAMNHIWSHFIIDIIWKQKGRHEQTKNSERATTKRMLRSVPSVSRCDFGRKWSKVTVSKHPLECVEYPWICKPTHLSSHGVHVLVTGDPWPDLFWDVEEVRGYTVNHRASHICRRLSLLGGLNTDKLPHKILYRWQSSLFKEK